MISTSAGSAATHYLLPNASRPEGRPWSPLKPRDRPAGNSKRFLFSWQRGIFPPFSARAVVHHGLVRANVSHVDITRSRRLKALQLDRFRAWAAGRERGMRLRTVP